MRFFLICCCWAFLVTATAQGIQFNKSATSWEEVKARAKAENKYIFVYSSASWCAPCLKMAAEVFTRPDVGEFFNSRFVSVKVQIDKAVKDDDYIKSWYAEAEKFRAAYEMPSLPTLYYFSPDGLLLHRLPGTYDAAGLLEKSAAVMDTSKQYYTLLRKCEQAPQCDPQMLKRLAIASGEVFERKNAVRFAARYMQTQQDLLTKENIQFVSRFVTSSRDTGFTLYLKHRARVNEVMGEGIAEERLRSIIMSEEIYKGLPNPFDTLPDWQALQKRITLKYPNDGAAVVSLFKVQYYMAKADWPRFEKAVLEHMNGYGRYIHREQLNIFAWTVFENCAGSAALTAALQWTRRTLDTKEKNARFLHTYANLLYKTGNIKEAIATAEKALACVEKDEKEEYFNNIHKMKKGEKTWK